MLESRDRSNRATAGESNKVLYCIYAGCQRTKRVGESWEVDDFRSRYVRLGIIPAQIAPYCDLHSEAPSPRPAA